MSTNIAVASPTFIRLVLGLANDCEMPHHANYFGLMLVQPRKFRDDFRREVRKHPLSVIVTGDHGFLISKHSANMTGQPVKVGL